MITSAQDCNAEHETKYWAAEHTNRAPGLGPTAIASIQQPEGVRTSRESLRITVEASSRFSTEKPGIDHPGEQRWRSIQRLLEFFVE